MSPTIIAAIVAGAVVVAVILYFVLRKPAVPTIDEPQAPAKLPPPAPTPLPGAEPVERGAPVSAASPQPESAHPPPSSTEAPVAETPLSEPVPVSHEEPLPDSLGPDSVDPISVETYDEPAPPPAPVTKRAKDVKGLRKGLSKVRQSGGLFGRLKALFGGRKEIDPEIAEELEEILITSDVGVKTTQELLGDIRERLEKNEFDDPDRVWEALRERASELLEAGPGAIRQHGTPTVVLMVGVNGTGKTTTIGKLATTFVAEGRKTLLVAGDTFRAAAVEQLKIWGQRVGCEVFAGDKGADPASVVFDAIEHGVQNQADFILVDTAGRLHTKANLMDELSKIVRTTGKALDGAPHETLLVVDATTGQNALQQAASFKEELPLTGIILTKLDGTAKGGIILAIRAEHDLAVRYIGVGERAEDLRDFDADEFVEAMLGLSDDDAAQAA